VTDERSPFIYIPLTSNCPYSL